MANDGDSAKTDDGAAAKAAEPKKEPEASKWGDDDEEETAPLKSENGSAGAFARRRTESTRPSRTPDRFAGAMKKTGSWAAIAKTGGTPPPPATVDN